MLTQATCGPTIRATSGDVQGATHEGDWPGLPMLIDKINSSCTFLGKEGGLEFNGSLQHLSVVYLLGSERPTSCVGIDLSVRPPCSVPFGSTQRAPFLSENAGGVCVCIFICSPLPGTVRIAEIASYTRGDGESLVNGHLHPTIPRQWSTQGPW